MIINFLKSIFVLLYKFFSLVISLINLLLTGLSLILVAFVFIFLCLLNGIWITFWFYLLLLIINPYKYLNENYQVKAKSISFLKYIWAVLLRIGKFVKYIWLLTFYFHFMDFYVAYPWRPRNFLLKITAGIFLRVLEELIDITGDIVLLLISKFRYFKFKYFYMKKQFLRKVYKVAVRHGKRFLYWRSLTYFKYLKLSFYVFFLWYSLYFLELNAKEIGPWWSPWSIPSFMLFFTIFLFLFTYYYFRHWKKVRKFLSENALLFWCVLGVTWAEAQYYPPGTWGVPPVKWLAALISFWF